LAFGATLLFAGLVTSMSVSVLGAALALAGCVGWFAPSFHMRRKKLSQWLPRDSPHHRSQGCGADAGATGSTASMASGTHISSFAGVKGGVAGSLAMAVLACAYGVLKAGSIWYPINLLAAVVYRESLTLGPAQLHSFMRTVSRLLFSCMDWSRFWLDCSTRNASHVATAPNLGWWTACSGVVVGVTLHNPWFVESITRNPY